MADAKHTSPGGSRREREFARHRQEILDTAEFLFAENGYYQTTMQMIADRVEFSVGYLYKHFAGKEEIYQEMVAAHLARLEGLHEQIEGRGLSPLEELRQTYRQVCRHFNAHRDFMRIFHEEIGGACDNILEGKKRHHEKIVGMLTRAQEAGELRPYEPRLLAAAIQGATKELFMELALREGDNPFDELPDTLFQLILDPLRK